jgi:hypothetical protein
MSALAPFVRHHTRQFESRPDGEYCACNHCLKWGYGEDSWQPLTTDFWPVIKGVLSLTHCKACACEKQMLLKGKRVGRFNATQEDLEWLATTIRTRVIDAHRHPGRPRSANTTAHTRQRGRSPIVRQAISHARNVARSGTP